MTLKQALSYNVIEILVVYSTQEVQASVYSEVWEFEQLILNLSKEWGGEFLFKFLIFYCYVVHDLWWIKSKGILKPKEDVTSPLQELLSRHLWEQALELES